MDTLEVVLYMDIPKKPREWEGVFSAKVRHCWFKSGPELPLLSGNTGVGVVWYSKWERQWMGNCGSLWSKATEWMIEADIARENWNPWITKCRVLPAKLTEPRVLLSFER